MEGNGEQSYISKNGAACAVVNTHRKNWCLSISISISIKSIYVYKMLLIKPHESFQSRVFIKQGKLIFSTFEFFL